MYLRGRVSLWAAVVSLLGAGLFLDSATLQAAETRFFQGSFTARGRLSHAESGCRWTETWTFRDVRFDLSRRVANFTFRVTQVPLVAECPHGDQSRGRQIPVVITGNTVTGSTRWGNYNVRVQAAIDGLFLRGTFQSTATAPFSGTDTGTFRLGEAGCEIALDGASVTRGAKQRLTARLTPHPAFKLRSVRWRFAGGNGGVRETGTRLFTDVILVDGSQRYTATVTAFSTVGGALCQATADLTVNRRPWKTSPVVALDNEAGWGSLPLANDITTHVFGVERDRVSNTPGIITPSPFVHQAWENGYRMARVIDPNGPNDGYYYLKSASLKIDQETVINKWIKSRGPVPAGAPSNWFQRNFACLTDPAIFVAAVKAHENSGSGPGSTGHFGLIRAAEAKPGMDPQTAIEDNTARNDAALAINTDTELYLIEVFLREAGSDQFVRGNWPGRPGLSFWNSSTQNYSPCDQFREPLWASGEGSLSASTEPGEGVQLCLEIAQRFRQAPPSGRSEILTHLGAVLESDPQSDSRFAAIACLAGIASAPLDPDSRASIADLMRDVFSLERNPAILAAALRLLPDVDRSQEAVSVLADLLNDSKRMQAHPELAKEALLSAGRLGPQAVPLLKSFLSTYPEASMIALSATGSEEAVETLVEEAGGSDPDRRYYAVHALALCTGPGF